MFRVILNYNTREKNFLNNRSICLMKSYLFYNFSINYQYSKYNKNAILQTCVVIKYFMDCGVPLVTKQKCWHESQLKW